MKATVDRKALHDALRIVTPAAGGTSYLPVTTGVRIEVGPDTDRLTLQCTNLDVTISAELEVDGGEAGVAIPPARLFAQFVASGAGDTVTLELDGDRLAVSVGEAAMAVACKVPEDWPVIEMPVGETVVFNASDLEVISRVLHSVHKDPKNPRPGLSGVHFEGDRAEASDTYRAAVGQLGVSGLPSVVVPVATLQSIIKAAKGDVTLVADEKRATFTTGAVAWTTTIIVDRFPDMVAFLARAEEACNRSFTVGREALSAAVNRATLIGDSDSHTVKLDPELDTFVVSARHVDVGDISDRVPFDGDWADTLSINGQYLSELLDAHPDDEVRFAVADGLKPIVSRSADRRLALIVMPVRS